MDFRSVACALLLAVVFAELGVATKVTKKEPTLNSIILLLESLESELAIVKSRNEHLQSTVDDLITRNEHLQSSVDDLVTRNEQFLADTELLKNNSEQLKKRLEYSEILSRKILPRTCHELRNLGITESGQYLIDPDGLGIGNDPIEAYCVMEDFAGSTILDVAPENSAPIDNQIRALIQMSEYCTGLDQGSLTCSGRKEVKAVESCESLLIAGHTAPGYYFLDGKKGVNYRLAKCNLDLQPTDIEFEIPTQVLLAEFPVAFDFFREEPYASVPFPDDVLNVGDGMTEEGVFTAPLAGIYTFHMYGMQCRGSHIVNTVLKIIVDGIIVAASSEVQAFPHGDSVGDNLEISVQTIIRLSKGSKVSIGGQAFDGNHLCFDENFHTRFTGALLYPIE